MSHKLSIADEGFTILNDVYTAGEVSELLAVINAADPAPSTFRRSEDIFAIRQFFKEVPGVVPVIFNDKLKAFMNEVFGDGYFVVKSIYFDKPKSSNWFVAWHQDLTISVDKKAEVTGYGPWTVKQDQFAVQPPVNILQNNFTIRIHLNDTDEGNGALKVIPGSHLKGIYRIDTGGCDGMQVCSCNVNAGGIMVMRPLLLHASGRTIDNRPRKVIHIEFSAATLPVAINWAEKLEFRF